MSKKVKMTFLEDVEVKDHNGEVEFSASQGDTKSLDELSANRWIKRGKALPEADAKALIQEAADAEKEKDADPKKEQEPEKDQDEK